MKKQKQMTLLFVLPFPNMVGNYVRALCLRDFTPDNWEFIYLKGHYPKLFNFYIIRFFFRFFFYLYKIFIIAFGNKKIIVYFIVPQNPWLLFILKNILRIKILIDINDAQHLDQFLGYKKISSIIKSSNYIIFESNENEEFWRHKINKPSSIVEDTPQHECIYIDYLKRKKKLIWVGSFHTSIYLNSFYDCFKMFYDHGYEIKILGGTKKISNDLKKLSIKHSYLKEYNLDNLVEELTSSRISFAPMENKELFNLRGNLKAKVSMGYGCLVVASNNAMHRRLIEHKKTGYLFNSKNELKNIISDLENNTKSSKIAFEGNKYVATNFTRLSHAKKLTEIGEKLINLNLDTESEYARLGKERLVDIKKEQERTAIINNDLMNEDYSCLRDPKKNLPVRVDKNQIISQSGDCYEIILGIPRFVSASNYSDDFGFQWKKFYKTQLDSFSGLQLSEKHLFNCLGFSPSLLKGKLVLEAGSGAGRFTEILLKYKCIVHSFDYSLAVEANAMNNRNDKNLVLVQADIRNMPFQKLSYDFVIGLGVLQHTPDPEESIRALWSMVKPGGQLIIDHYRFRWRTFLPPPFGQALGIYRRIILSIPISSRFKVVKRLVDFWFPIHWKYRKSFFLTRVLRRLSPVIFHYHYLSLKDKEMYYQWALLDTHDSTTDHYRHLRSQRQIEDCLRDIGATDIIVTEGGSGIEARYGIEARCRKSL